ncbi:hypothetical protein ACMFMF_010624 [Clarireedia jacksonii]
MVRQHFARPSNTTAVNASSWFFYQVLYGYTMPGFIQEVCPETSPPVRSIPMSAPYSKQEVSENLPLISPRPNIERSPRTNRFFFSKAFEFQGSPTPEGAKPGNDGGEI